jgi:hypothetical protein
MSYSAEISRANPACFLFLIDQSYSMADLWGGGEAGTKADEVARTINRILQELVGRCSSGDEVRRYFQVGVFGYGAIVGPALAGSLSGQNLVWIDEIANNPVRMVDLQKRVPDGAGGLVETTIRMPLWFDPVANGGTPMVAAFEQAVPTIEEWASAHPNSYPPIVMNITDGESTDGDPSVSAAQLVNAHTNDGATLLFNLHVSSSRAKPIIFPTTEDALPDQYAALLFRMSSELPAGMREVAHDFGYSTSAGSRGFVFNARLEDMIGFLNIGTRPSNMR